MTTSARRSASRAWPVISARSPGPRPTTKRLPLPMWRPEQLPLSAQRVLLLHGPTHLRALLLQLAEEGVQVAPEDHLQLAVAQFAQHPAQDAVRLAERPEHRVGGAPVRHDAGGLPLDGRQR